MKIKLILTLLITLNTSAQVTFVAESSRDTIGYKEKLKVTFSANNDMEDFNPPSFENFEIIGGPYQSLSSSWVDGKRIFNKTYAYYIQPIKKGQLLIPSASMQFEGKIYKTLPLSIFVMPSPDEIEKSQKEGQREINYEKPSLKYNEYDKAIIQWEQIDLSKLNWIVDKSSDKTSYYFDIPFVITNDIPDNSSFVFLLGVKKFFWSWGILNEKKEGIVKTFKKYKIGDETYIVQSQENLTQRIKKDKYYVRLFTSLDYTFPVYCIISVSSMPNESINEIKLSLKNKANKN